MMKFLKDPKVLKVLGMVAAAGVQIAASLISKHQQEQEVKRIVEKVLNTTQKGNV